MTVFEKVIALAEEAGREIKKYYDSGDWTVTGKADESPLTQADLAANEILVGGLSVLVSDPIISEESTTRPTHLGERFWLIDPLDGTRDFVAKKDTFVVCVAMIENFYPTFGVIHSPVTGETWWAKKGEGAFGPRGRLKVQSGRTPLIAAGSRSMPSERMQMFYDLFEIKEVRRMGSAIKFCKIAEGEADLYPRFGPTYEWDTAAGQIILEEAGGLVIEVTSGERLRYDKPNLENRGGFMASRGDLNPVADLKKLGRI